MGAYFLTREYGGPEEGGWWWNCYKLLESRACAPERIEQVMAQLRRRYDDRVQRRRTHDGRLVEVSIYSVQSHGTLTVLLEDRPGEHTTTVVPRYE